MQILYVTIYKMLSIVHIIILYVYAYIYYIHNTYKLKFKVMGLAT